MRTREKATTANDLCVSVSLCPKQRRAQNKMNYQHNLRFFPEVWWSFCHAQYAMKYIYKTSFKILSLDGSFGLHPKHATCVQ